jgi:heterodisulfide reductase subunit B2
LKFAYYPGCTIWSTAIEYGQSVGEISKKLGIDLQVIPDWNCCGASSGHVIDKELAIALPGRNLALAEGMSLDIVTACPSCFLRHKIAQYELKKDSQLKTRVEKDLGMKLELSLKMKHILQALFQDIGIEAIQKNVRRPLKGIKAVTYYGCYLVRPYEATEFDDPENPKIMDKIMQALGVDVIDWSYKVDCCGGPATIPNPEIVKQLSGKIIDGAKEAGAEAIITACHICQSNLDTCQPENEKTNSIPIFYFSELMALAFGSPHMKEYLAKHMISPYSLLKRLKLYSEQNENS